MKVSNAIKPWHAPRNEACAHNADPAQACTCKRIRAKRPYKQIVVRDGARVLILRVYPDGELEVHEKRRRSAYRDTVAGVYDRAVRVGALAKRRAGK